MRNHSISVEMLQRSVKLLHKQLLLYDSVGSTKLLNRLEHHQVGIHVRLRHLHEKVDDVGGFLLGVIELNLVFLAIVVQNRVVRNEKQSRGETFPFNLFVKDVLVLEQVSELLALVKQLIG